MKSAERQKQDLRRSAEAVKPSSFLDYKDYLRTLYTHVKAELGQYSFIQFASDLGFSPTNVVHHIIQGRRPLTKKAAATIAKALELKGTEAKYFNVLVLYANSKSSTERDRLFRELYALKEALVPTAVDKDALEYFSEWYHPVIGEATRLREFESDPKWISANLIPSVRPAQIEKSLALLERLGLIVYDHELGRHVRTSKDLSTGHEARGMATAQYHHAMIEHGREAVAKVAPEARDISSMTLCLSTDSLKKLKSMIHQFQTEVLAEEECSDRKEQVYQLNIQLFPFTKIKAR